MTNQKTFGDRVAYLREQLGITQSELGRRIKKTPQTIQKIEGGGNAREQTVDALVRELKTTKAYLLAGEEATVIVASDNNAEEENCVPLVEWKNIGLSFEDIQNKGLIIDNISLVSGRPEGIICTTIEGGDWMDLTDNTIAYVNKDFRFEDIAHDSYIIISLNGKNLLRKLFIEGDRRLAVTTNKSMPISEREIQSNDVVGVITGFYIPV